jgi:hypothetical protein
VDQILCHIECEKPILKGEHSWLFWIFFGLLAPVYAVFYSLVKQEPEVIGEGTALDVPISLCPFCQERASGANVLREALCRNQDFARLFDKFPSAKVWLLRDVHT